SLPPALEVRDRAAAHRIAAAVLRRTGSLDAVLEPFLSRNPPGVVRAALRMGAAELLLLGTPPHAAVASTVGLVPRPFAGLVNAVLRKVASEGPAALELLDGARLDTPPWLWSAWHAAYGADGARAIAEAHEDPAPLDLSHRDGATPPEGAFVLPTGTWRMPAGTRITELPGFDEGLLWAQDAAAALPALLLDPKPGERIADLCAAPGGKTAQLAASGAEVVAVERDSRRALRLRENLVRLKLKATIVEADATTWRPDGQFDAVLLDAPCSATGTIRRHPDVAHLKRIKDVQSAAELQAKLIVAATALLRPGGRLIFATCSLQMEEGEAQAAKVKGLELSPFDRQGAVWEMGAITPAGMLRTRPDMLAGFGGMDGFFAVRFVRGI
ncbi:MAG: rRNA cytosine-C5-methylase, partial [Hyphomicrobiales bacterium]|nr:rRNA cytosine-C5-methylase [Hyphomicrobiales bacterium]